MRPNLSKLHRVLERPQPPTVEEVIRGPQRAPEITPEEAAGRAAVAVLAAREQRRAEDFHAQRAAVAAEGVKLAEAAWARIEARWRGL